MTSQHHITRHKILMIFIHRLSVTIQVETRQTDMYTRRIKNMRKNIHTFTEIFLQFEATRGRPLTVRYLSSNRLFVTFTETGPILVLLRTSLISVLAENVFAFHGVSIKTLSSEFGIFNKKEV